jgi:Ca2+:H+ antiporter
VLLPVAVVLELAHAEPVLIFATAGLTILPLAGIIGHATEELAARTGPRSEDFSTRRLATSPN